MITNWGCDNRWIPFAIQLNSIQFAKKLLKNGNLILLISCEKFAFKASIETELLFNYAEKLQPMSVRKWARKLHDNGQIKKMKCQSCWLLIIWCQLNFDPIYLDVDGTAAVCASACECVCVHYALTNALSSPFNIWSFPNRWHYFSAIAQYQFQWH